MLSTLEQQIRAREAKIAQARTRPELLRLAAEGEQLLATLQHLRSELLREQSELTRLSNFARASRREETPATVIEITA